MSIGITLAVLANVLWAFGNVLNVKLARELTPLKTVLWQTLFLLLILMPVTLIRPFIFDIQAVLLTIALSFTLYSGSLMFYKALDRGSAQISGAITATVPAFVVILSVLFLNSAIATIGLLLIAIITVGLVIVSWPTRSSRLDAGVLYAFTAVLLWAIYFTFITKSIERIGPYWANYISVISGSIMLLVYYYFQPRKGLLRPKKKMLLLVLLSAFFVGGAPLVFNLALEKASPTVVAPIAGSYAPLFIVVSSILYGDKISKRQWLGIVITILAVIAFSILSG